MQMRSANPLQAANRSQKKMQIGYANLLQKKMQKPFIFNNPVSTKQILITVVLVLLHSSPADPKKK